MTARIRGSVVTVVLAAAAAIPAPALAQTPSPVVRNYGWYLGAAVGQSDARDACTGIPVSCDNKDIGWKILGGYQFNPNFGLEAAYIDFGKATASGVVLGVNVDGSAKATAAELVAVGNVPVGAGFSIYGKAGVFRWDADLSVSAPTAGFRASTSDSGTDLTFGAGVRYDFNLRGAVRLEWQRYKDVGNASTVKSDIDFLNVALIFKF
jgi:OmpA-OmpF porin, OOP family